MKLKNLFAVMAVTIGAGGFVSHAQSASGSYHEVYTAPDSRTKAFRPGEVIVKFKDTQTVMMRKAPKGGGFTSGISSVDKVMAKFDIAEVEQLMPLSGKVATPRRIKSHNGSEVMVRDMSRLYCLKAKGDIDVNRMVEKLKTLPEVEFAEPNYLVYINSMPDDPLYKQQWGIPAINADKLWDMPLTGKKRPVIAILDTGVDISHPDLKDNIWTNRAELDGASGYDDDNNGFIDDCSGWDFVNRTGEIDDYNGHGTHCAGIAAATGNNGIGIIGANPDALIMPVTVMQSDGTGDVGTIIKGIDYATANGADIISMSFGGYSYSIAEEEALARAYANAVLVAAAGNDGQCIYPHRCPPPNGPLGSPMFPAAFTFVLGVQASSPDAPRAGFSNYDDDGPIYFSPLFFSEEQMYNYELTAPGSGIVSTYPGGKYKAFNGTSMACPLVAGAVSRLLSAKEYATKELLFGDLIHSAASNVDILAAYKIEDKDRKPNVSLVSWRIEDETDNDGRFDAGEWVNFYPVLRNEWGTAQNVKVWMELGELEGKVIEFQNSSVDFEKPLSSYAKAESANPIRFKVADNVVDGRHIRLVVNAQCEGMEAPMSQEIDVIAENGIELKGMIDHDMTLEPGLSYIVTQTLAIPEGVTLTIKPGVVIKMHDNTGIVCDGTVIANGEPGNMITITKADLASGNVETIDFKENVLSYVKICDLHFLTHMNKSFWGSLASNCIFKNCTFYRGGITSIKTNIVDCVTNGYIDYWCTAKGANSFRGTNIIGLYNNYDIGQVQNVSNWFEGGNNVLVNYWMKDLCNLVVGYDYNSATKFVSNSPGYFGASTEKIVRKGVHDIESGFKFAKYDLSNMLTRPNPEAHGLVWKVVVDGYDAQDEFDILPPLGVGRHKFEVYYSKVIDQSEAPVIAMGVRPPYTQTAIGEEGFWRTETLHFSPFGNGAPQSIKLLCGGFDQDWYSKWNLEYKSGWNYVYVDGGQNPFDGYYGMVYSTLSPKVAAPFKNYQELPTIQNGVYKFRIAVKPDAVAEEGKGLYIFANGDKTYLTSTDAAYYEVTTTVLKNNLVVGLEQDDTGVATAVEFDNASLELIKELPNGWDVDCSVYTAYLDIKGGMAIDGLNRIYVNGCADLEYFPIPGENTRFNVEVAAAGSMSTGFYGEAGVGKVMLTWEEQEENVDDILGYNLYRYTTDESIDTDGNVIYTDTDPVRINRRLLDETTYTDFDVVPGKTYSYFYKIMRTSMQENSPSRVVAVTPVTASKGDANGSMNVDIADVVTEVGYMLAQDPQPFIFEAADVNDDSEINILDVVGTLNIILHPEATGVMTEGSATCWVRDGILYVDTDVALAGLQFTLDGVTDNRQFSVLESLDGMEVTGGIVNGNYLFMAYSMVGRTLPPGTHALLKLNGDVTLSDVCLSDPQGHNIEVSSNVPSGMETLEEAKTLRPTPNPFIESVEVPYAVPFDGLHRVSLLFHDISGRRIDSFTAKGVAKGEYTYRWTPKVLPGIYFATYYLDGKSTGITYRLIKK